MKIEQDRGISVATSVMTFEQGGLVFNLLDTPGHEDFSEDTYRTLTAVDAAVMVLDAAKGIESQTRKLFEVCRLRDIPIVTFVNKVDREGRDPLDLLDEIEKTLALDVTPASWPIGQGRDLLGVYDMLHPALRLVTEDGETHQRVSGLDDPALDRLLPPERAAELREQAEFVGGASPAFDRERFLQGTMTPVFFGSALRDFGVSHLLEGLAPWLRPRAPPRRRPRRRAGRGQADRASCSRCRPTWTRSTATAWPSCASARPAGEGHAPHPDPHAEAGTVNAPLFFFAKDRQVAEEAWPGDVVGIANHGTLRIGDTLTEGEALNFRGVPSFAPEHLRRVRLDDPMLAKRLKRALEQLAEEGVVQVFRPE
jgi:peptide chain release factor 3